MTILNGMRMMLRKIGLDVHRYSVLHSTSARINRLLNLHHVDTVLDVGANDGGYGRELRSSGYKGRILSFEPLVDVNHQLDASTSRDVNWRIAPPMALGQVNDRMTINVAGNSTSSSILEMEVEHLRAAPQSAYVGKQEVLVRRLDGISDSFIEEASAIFLKIDTQGYEYPVLLGANGLLDRIVGIQIELSLVPLYDGQKLYREMIDELARRGFDLMLIIPGFSDAASGRMLQMDGVFFKA